MISEEQVRAEAVGRSLEPGSYDISPHRAWLTADSVCSPPLPDGVAHPIFGYLVAQGGVSSTLEEMFAMVHATSDDGVMLGTADIEFVRPLMVGRRYRVTAAVADIRRKEGRSGTFDLVDYRYEMVEDGIDEPAATATLVFVYPRRG